MRSIHFKIVVLLIAAFGMMACSSEAPKSESEKTSTESSGPSAPVSGKTAFWAMYKPAYQWANDVAPLKLESKSIPGVKNEAGNAGMWSATFGSARKHEAIEISYAVAAQPPDIVKGVNVGHTMSWGGPTRDVAPFQGSDLVTDSDAAYKTAAAQAQSWLKDHPDKEVSFLLGYNPNTFSTPVWYVLWGDKKSGYRVFVNTKTGELSKALK